MRVTLLALLVFASSAMAFAAPADVRPSTATVAQVRAAIETAVRERMGDDADVVASRLEIVGDVAAAFLQAVPEPDARISDRMTFRLLGASGRGETARVLGSASATVSVAVEHVRAKTLVVRGREVTDADVERVDGPVLDLPLRRLPRLDEVQGARALVNLAPGEVVAKTAVVTRPAVKIGQVVRAIARVDGLEVTASLVAAQDGVPGAVIRVVNKESRRELRARVLEPGVVEVIP